MHGRGARVPRVFMATPLRILDSATRKKCTRYHFPMNSTERHEARYQRRKAARIEKKAKALKEFGDFGAVFSFDHLYASYRASIKGVGWKASTQRYKSSALAHIAKTQEELLTGKYRSRGFSFVKVRFRYGRTGKIVRKATYQGIRHMMQKLKIFRRWVDRGRMAATDVAASVTSWLGHMRRFHSYFAVQKVLRQYNQLFPGGTHGLHHLQTV